MNTDVTKCTVKIIKIKSHHTGQTYEGYYQAGYFVPLSPTFKCLIDPRLISVYDDKYFQEIL